MEVPWIAVVAIAIAAAAVLIAFRWGQQPNSEANIWPPGPPKLPMIGNMHQIIKGRDLFHVAVTKLARVYGPLMTLWLGSSQPTIIVSDHDLAWEVLVSKSSDFADRHSPTLPKLLISVSSVINSHKADAHWHALRRGLQTEAVGPLSLSLQTHLQESDMAQMIADISDEASRNRGLVHPFHHIRRATIRLLARLCFGSNFSNTNFDATMDELVEDFLSHGDAARLLDAFPSTRFFFPSVRHSIAQMEKLRPRVMELIGTHLISSRPPPNCYAHFLLSESFSRETAIFSIFEVFVFGLDSTGSTTLWALGLLVQNQVVQQKLYQEITEKEDGIGIVKVEQVGKLVYLQAAMKEAMRLKPIAPLAVPHRVARETTLNGMRVAEGTTVIINLYALHRDPKVWDEPDEFMPERWLVEQSKTMQHSFLPFGAGMRACAGMDVGKLQLAFMVSNLVNAFHWSNAVEGEMPDLAEDFTFVLAMKTPLKARVVPRGI